MKRQQIIDAITELCAGITIENGYETDAGAKVFEWRTAALESEELDSIIIEDPECTVVGKEENDNCDGENHIKNLRVELYSVTNATPGIGQTLGSAAAERLRAVRRDILKALKSETNLSDLVAKVELTGDSMDMYSADRLYAGLNLTLNIHYVVPAWED